MGALLAVDIGNSQTAVGVFRERALVAHFRVQTLPGRTADETAVVVRSLCELEGLAWGEVSAAIIASVVPAAVHGWQQCVTRWLGAPVLVVGQGVKTGMPILTEQPRDVGADRIANAIAAYAQVGAGCVVVDVGTATTWDVVNPKGEYLGGAIAAGPQLAAEALFARAAKLPRVELVRPAKLIGRSTVSAMQAGLVCGYAAMLEGMIARLRAEVDFPLTCVVTGGAARLFAADVAGFDVIDDHLTLKGLQLLYERNLP